MPRICALFLLSIFVLMLPTTASASGCCDERPRWKLANSAFAGYDSNAVLVPGNDSRVNLLLLLADKRPPGTLRLTRDPTAQKSVTPIARITFDWSAFHYALSPPPAPVPGSAADTSDNGNRSRCQSNLAAIVAFETALNANRKITAPDKAVLMQARRAMQPNCVEGPANENASPLAVSGPAKPFALYLQGAQAFYSGAFDAATLRFTALNGAADPWVKETALYMRGRTAVNRAQVGAVNDYGSLTEPAQRDQKVLADAEAALLAYLRAYPAGRYAVSARGLLRRIYWLGGQRGKLIDAYRTLFTINDPDQRGLSDFMLVEEMDKKLLPNLEIEETTDPALLAVLDLMKMRVCEKGVVEGDFGTGFCNKSAISVGQIEAQRTAFANDQPLYDYVLAAHAYFVDGKPASVLQLIPDAARQKQFSYVQFSRQMLRGLALDAVKDGNARGFWMQMIEGATQPYQRQALELALAMHEERNGGLARVFAAGSQIRDPDVREMLLNYGAGPDLLRQQATDKNVPARERDAALFTLLYKDLARGRYAAFASDVRLVQPGSPFEGGYLAFLNYRSLEYSPPMVVELGLFTSSKNLGDYGCPAIGETAALLAKSPGSAGSTLCLAEFMRINGFDKFALDTAMPKDQLGGAPSLFPGKPFSRQTIYQDIIADAKAPAEDKAYALYRAVYCYAPGGSNDCGGSDVEISQRRAWFVRLKKDYPKSRWAQSLKLYW